LAGKTSGGAFIFSLGTVERLANRRAAKRSAPWAWGGEGGWKKRRGKTGEISSGWHPQMTKARGSTGKRKTTRPAAVAHHGREAKAKNRDTQQKIEKYTRF